MTDHESETTHLSTIIKTAKAAQRKIRRKQRQELNKKRTEMRNKRESDHAVMFPYMWNNMSDDDKKDNTTCHDDDGIYIVDKLLCFTNETSGHRYAILKRETKCNDDTFISFYSCRIAPIPMNPESTMKKLLRSRKISL